MFSKKVDDQISLILTSPEHANALFSLVDGNRDYLSQWMVWPPLNQKVADATAFIKRSLQGFAEHREMACGIEYNGELVGSISFNLIDHNLRKVELGYWLAENMQGKGIISRACKVMIDYAFTRLEMQKVEIRVAEHNHPSNKVCQRLGFKLEGCLRNAENLRGMMLDYNIYGLTIDEYEGSDPRHKF
ncbi:MAG: hypothetical protein OFPI_02370 [Osedax symbiont Rs2]|nr:MAG: hypothetical protein OFPI_02370 [Osedax symbiont Rs2]